MEKLPRDVARRLYRKLHRAQHLPETPGKKFSRPCLLWTGAVDNDGYAVFRAYPGCMGLPSGIVRVHRLIYWLRKGPFPRNLQIDHQCRVKNCGEISHLELMGVIEHGKKSRTDQEMDEIIEDIEEGDDLGGMF